MTDLTLPEPNIPLLRKAVEWAEAEAAKTDGTSQWNQARWAIRDECGTAYCVAGYIATISEPALTVLSSYDGEVDVLNPYVDGELRWWDAIAIEHLGITEDEADDLFEANNTITRVRQVAEAIAARAGERL